MFNLKKDFIMKNFHEQIVQKRGLLSEANLDITNEELKRIYLYICSKEQIRPGKVDFFDSYNEKYNGITFVKQFEFFGLVVFRKFKIVIQNDKYCLLYLMHEIAHQLLIVDMSDFSHSENFKKVKLYLVKKYFINFLNTLKKKHATYTN